MKYEPLLPFSLEMSKCRVFELMIFRSARCSFREITSQLGGKFHLSKLESDMNAGVFVPNSICTFISQDSSFEFFSPKSYLQQKFSSS